MEASVLLPTFKNFSRRSQTAEAYTIIDHSASVLSRYAPDGRSAYFSKCSGLSGSEMACSPPNHLPRSMSLQRCEQNGPYFPANQSPDFLQVGHLTGGMATWFQRTPL